MLVKLQIIFICCRKRSTMSHGFKGLMLLGLFAGLGPEASSARADEPEAPAPPPDALADAGTGTDAGTDTGTDADRAPGADPAADIVPDADTTPDGNPVLDTGTIEGEPTIILAPGEIAPE
jgi:hypothetical protein